MTRTKIWIWTTRSIWRTRIWTTWVWTTWIWTRRILTTTKTTRSIWRTRIWTTWVWTRRILTTGQTKSSHHPQRASQRLDLEEGLPKERNGILNWDSGMQLTTGQTKSSPHPQWTSQRLDLEEGLPKERNGMLNWDSGKILKHLNRNLVKMIYKKLPHRLVLKLSLNRCLKSFKTSSASCRIILDVTCF